MGEARLVRMLDELAENLQVRVLEIDRLAGADGLHPAEALGDRVEFSMNGCSAWVE